MNKPFYILFFSLVMLLTTGCGSSSQVTYIQGAVNLPAREITENYDLRIKKDDMLSIRVYCREPELAAPFNPDVAGNETKKGVLVNSVGDIDYPVFGRIRAEGLTCTQLADKIREMLITAGYIQDPTVNVSIVNFKVSILGEVTQPGIMEIISERVTIFEAIAEVRDISIFGKRKSVKLIREENGQRKVYQVDLTDPALMNTPYYYLQQNDVIYVEPNSTKTAQRNISPWIGTGISIISFMMTLGLYIFK